MTPAPRHRPISVDQLRTSGSVSPPATSSSSSSLGPVASPRATSSRLRCSSGNAPARWFACAAEPACRQDLDACVRGRRGRAAPAPWCGADQHVLEDRHLLEGPRHLVGAADARLGSAVAGHGGDVLAVEERRPASACRSPEIIANRMTCRRRSADDAQRPRRRARPVKKPRPPRPGRSCLSRVRIEARCRAVHRSALVGSRSPPSGTSWVGVLSTMTMSQANLVPGRHCPPTELLDGDARHRAGPRSRAGRTCLR